MNTIQKVAIATTSIFLAIFSADFRIRFSLRGTGTDYFFHVFLPVVFVGFAIFIIADIAKKKGGKNG